MATSTPLLPHPSDLDRMLGDLPDELQLALAPNIRIIRELGGGGMSRVFLAEEVALGREVVIKVLPPDMAVGVNAERFRREMQLVARLQHPHIVPVLSTGVAGEVLFYVMPFIKGESLRARLARDVAIPVEEAARILREVADALGYAHDHGVVHRDIKPDNVLLTSGHALVADFGVAKALGVGEQGEEGGGLTSVGMALGTPTYMAPEQAAADPHTDHRADLYALGVMAYEMLVGQPPFVAPTPQALIAAHFSRTPESTRQARPAVPPNFDDLVLRCLAKQPADRFQRAADLLPLLDQIGHPSGAVPTVPRLAPTSPSPNGTIAAPRSSARLLAYYLGGAAVVLAIVWALRLALGLPDWVVVAAVGLLAIGLPIVLRASRREQSAAAHAEAPRLSTVRGALTAGAMAFLGLGSVTGTIVGLRAMGIGPFATLLSAGTLSERDKILVAEFENSTADSTLGTALTEALTIDLSQSKVVGLMSPTEIRDALGRMQRAASTRLTPEVATEVAAREGVKVIVVGEIAPLAGGFTLSARVLDAKGATLYATRATANGPSEIIPALEKVSRKVREEIGESLRSIRGTQSLEQVSTSSLEALQLYSRAMRSKAIDEDVDRLPLLRQAVALDSSFGMAWRAIAAELINARGDINGVVEAVQRMQQLKDRLPAREQLQADAVLSQVDGNMERGIEAQRRILASWPDDRQARNGLGLYLRASGRYQEAERAFAVAIAEGTATPSMLYNMVTTQIPQGRFAAAESTLVLFHQRFPKSPNRLQARYYLSAATSRFAEALAAADSLTRVGGGARYTGYNFKAQTEAVRGQLRAAESSTRAAIQVQREQRNLGGALQEQLGWLWTDLQLRGDSAAVRAGVDAALAAMPIDSIPLAARPYGDLIRLRAALGQLDQARRVQSEYARVMPEPVRTGDNSGWLGLAYLALAEGKVREAIPLARRASRGCDGCTGDVIGQAFEQLGEVDSAIVAYERALRPPTYAGGLRTWIPSVVPRALFRVAGLYEKTGARQQARDRYATFADLWKDADPVLQPAVSAARDRLKALAGER